MRIFMLSWEYPPRVIGGLARHVHQLSVAMARMGHDVHVFTCGEVSDSKSAEYGNGALKNGNGAVTCEEGVTVHRVLPSGATPRDFVTWVMQLNFDLLEAAIRESEANGPCEIVHAHDWLTAYSAKALKHAYRIPLVATIHATEWGRNHGLHNDLQRYISDEEWYLCYESWRVICCSDYMRGELKWVFQLPEDKIRVIPNGVDPEEFEVDSDINLSAFRSKYAAPDEKMIFFIGRLVHEKGAHILVEATPKILHYWDKAKIVIAGKGPQEAYLKERAQALGVSGRIYFTGYVDDNTRNLLYRCADIAVFPSLYEPFGITALEAMACGVPVVVSDVGGLAEVVRHGLTGWKVYAGNPGSLADGVLHLLYEPKLADKLRQNALKIVESKYNWPSIAEETIRVYQEILDQYNRSEWSNIRRESVRTNASRMVAYRQFMGDGRYAST